MYCFGSASYIWVFLSLMVAMNHELLLNSVYVYVSMKFYILLLADGIVDAIRMVMLLYVIQAVYCTDTHAAWGDTQNCI